MIVTIRVQPRSSKPGVEKTGATEYRVRVHAAPADGQANAELVERLAAYFGVPRTNVRILRGATSRLKVVSIDNVED